MAILCALGVAASGCYSSVIVGGHGLRELERGGHGQELILRDHRGGAVRLGPNSSLRFVFPDRSFTRWLPARELRVNEGGVYRRGRRVASWEEVYGAQVSNLSGPKSFGAVLGVMLIAGAIVLLIASKGKAFKGLGRAVGRAAIFTAKVVEVMRPVRGAGRFHPVRRYDRDHIGPPPSDLPPPSREEPSRDQPLPTPAAKPVGPPLALFSSRLLRSSKLALLAGLEGGADFMLEGDATASFYVGLRLNQSFDLAVGGRLAVLRDNRTAANPRLTQWTAFGRLAGHFDLDVERWISLAIGADAGGGHALLYLRLLFGLRIKLGLPWLRLGIYPFNVTFTQQRDTALRWGQGGSFTFPTTLDLSFTL